MLSYAFGGPLADRFSAKKLMAVALWLTAMGGVFIAFNPSPVWLVLIYGFWGFTTIFLFWAAMIRATREWGGHLYQGRAFGWLEGGRGLVAAILGTLTWLVFAKLSLVEQALTATQSLFQPLQKVIFITSLLTAFSTGIYAIRALYFGVLREAGIPLTLTGTAVGIVSFLGYTPDVLNFSPGSLSNYYNLQDLNEL